MKKEIDTYKIEALVDVFKGAILWAWYLFGVIIAAALWFFPAPQTRIQVFMFATAFVVYTLLSIMLSKVQQIKQECGR